MPPVEAAVVRRPSINSTGPTPPPMNTTSASHGRSARRNGASEDEAETAPRTRYRTARPRPEPR